MVIHAQLATAISAVTTEILTRYRLLALPSKTRPYVRGACAYSVIVVDEILRYNFDQQVEELDVTVQTLVGYDAGRTWMKFPRCSVIKELM